MFLSSYDFRSSAWDGPFPFTLSAGAAEWKVSKVMGPKSSFCSLIANIGHRPPCAIIGRSLWEKYMLHGLSVAPHCQTLRSGVFASPGDLGESTTGRFVMNEKSCPKTFFIIGFHFTTL